MLGTIGSIANFLATSYTLPTGISGNLVIIVDNARQNVANYVGTDIGSNSIDPQYEPAIISFSKADTIDMLYTQLGRSISLGELSVTGDDTSAESYRLLGNSQLSSIGRKVRFKQNIS